MPFSFFIHLSIMKQEIFITTDAVIFAQKENEIFVLLIQRKNEPFKNQWALPGGFVEENEKLITACQRELKEETSLHIELQDLSFVGIFDDVQRDPRNRTISAAYASLINELFPVKAADDAADARWVKLNKLKNMAFDHDRIIARAKAALKLS